MDSFPPSYSPLLSLAACRCSGLLSLSLRRVHHSGLSKEGTWISWREELGWNQAGSLPSSWKLKTQQLFIRLSRLVPTWKRSHCGSTRCNSEETCVLVVPCGLLCLDLLCDSLSCCIKGDKSEFVQSMQVCPVQLHHSSFWHRGALPLNSLTQQTGTSCGPTFHLNFQKFCP